MKATNCRQATEEEGESLCEEGVCVLMFGRGGGGRMVSDLRLHVLCSPCAQIVVGCMGANTDAIKSYV